LVPVLDAVLDTERGRAGFGVVLLYLRQLEGGVVGLEGASVGAGEAVGVLDAGAVEVLDVVDVVGVEDVGVYALVVELTVGDGVDATVSEAMVVLGVAVSVVLWSGVTAAVVVAVTVEPALEMVAPRASAAAAAQPLGADMARALA
jgi:hypothetical protein